MEEMNQELEKLSKSLAGVTVTSVLKKHKITNEESITNQLSEEQKQELRNIAENLESLVGDFTSKNKPENVKQELDSVESPIRELMKKVNKKESGE
ncbi:hypothetical protein SAMN04487943_103333 [Gracilibacillus orientalis]|uniref:Uncharacterized protein n=1 Tax=Gracilibacillus orientalis TaxID=334253 RepID=A0A1I4K3R7_9BACI|nr:hypothetical protein [Gracilibacillus orientalis]SFL73309.1 hypothetical protein SAMN04487943_103333 [Gracilibacillus orientalis]